MTKPPPLALISGVKLLTGFAVGHGARFAVIQVDRKGPRTGSLKSPCMSSIQTIGSVIM